MISAQSTGAPARKTKYRSFLSNNIERGLKGWSYQCDSLPPLHLNPLFCELWSPPDFPPSHSLFNHSFVSITFLWKRGILVACWPPACWHIFLRGSGGQRIWPFLRLCSKEGKELKWQYREEKPPKTSSLIIFSPRFWLHDLHPGPCRCCVLLSVAKLFLLLV